MEFDSGVWAHWKQFYIGQAAERPKGEGDVSPPEAKIMMSQKLFSHTEDSYNFVKVSNTLRANFLGGC